MAFSENVVSCSVCVEVLVTDIFACLFGFTFIICIFDRN